MKSLLLFLITLSWISNAQGQPVFKAGAATSNITPPLGMEIVGNFAPRPVAKHVHDELHVRCLVLDDGTTKLAFAVADTISLSRDVWDEAKKKIEAVTGIPVANMMFSGTHTHSSVSAITNKDPSLDYRRLIISRTVDGVRRALNNLEPARIAWGSGKLPQHVFNRRWLLKEGVTNDNPFGGKDRAVMNPGSLLRPRLAGPAGPTNPEVYCLSVQAADGRQIALMANYWLHYVGGVNKEDLSADYFGEFCRRIEEKMGAPCVGLLANGPCGDVNNNDYSGKTPAVKREPYEKIKLVAGDLAQEVLRVQKTLRHRDPSAANQEMMALCHVLCPNRPMFLEAGAKFRDYYAQRRAAGTELAFYSCNLGSRLADPYAYFRLQAWTAWQCGAEASYFWAFSDSGGGSSWNEYAMAASTCYTPLFLERNSVTGSKQMEAIRESVEDYEYFVMLRDLIAAAEKAGGQGVAIARAKELLATAAGRVLDAPGAEKLTWAEPKDRTQADKVRVQMLEAMSALSTPGDKR